MLSIIIPCFNEVENFDYIFSSIEDICIKYKNIEFIIVENGSTDNSRIKIYSYINKKYNIKLIIIDKNRGYGFGVYQGLLNANGDYVTWCHADLQVNIEQIYTAFKINFHNLRNQKVIIKGIRKNRVILDSIFTFFMSLICSLAYKQILSDINSQPKIIEKKFIQKIKKNYPYDFNFDLFFLHTALKNNYRLINYPVIVQKRLAGLAKGGGSLKGKILLSLNTLRYIYKNNQLWK